MIKIKLISNIIIRMSILQNGLTPKPDEKGQVGPPIKQEMSINSVKLFKPTADVSDHLVKTQINTVFCNNQFKPKFIDAPLNPIIPEDIKKQVEIIKSNFNLNAPLFQPVPGISNGLQNGLDHNSLLSATKKKSKKKKKNKKKKRTDDKADSDDD